MTKHIGTTKCGLKIDNRKFQMLAFMTTFCLCIYIHNTYAGTRVRKGNTVIFNGNAIRLSGNDEAGINNLTAAEAGSKDTQPMLRRSAYPLTLNGETVYDEDVIKTKPSFISGGDSLDAYVVAGLKKELSKRPENDYYLFVYNIIVNNTGKIVYYDIHGLMYWEDDPNDKKIKRQALLNDPKMIKTIENVMDNMPMFTPATIGGKPVASFSGSTLVLASGKKINNRKGKVSIEKY